MGARPEPGSGANDEIAVSTDTAEQLQRDLGAAMTLCVSCGAPEEPKTAPVTIVGVFEPIDPSADEWADQTLLSPTVVKVDQEHTEVHGTALIATGDVAPLWTTFKSSFRYAWRFILHWDDSSAAASDTIAAELGTLRVTYPFRGSTEGSDVPSVSTGLLTILERYAAERSTAQAAIILALIGPAAAAIGALGMIAATIARRRQSAVRVVRARGAADRQVIVTRLILALVIVVPATALPAAAMIVLAGPAWALGIGLIAIAMAVLTLSLVIITTRHVLREDAGLLRQARPTAWWGGPRSLVRDGLLVAVAVAGVIWIGQRGATETAGSSTNAVTSASAIVGVDPLLVLVPTIVALTGGLIAWRCYLPIVRVLSAMAAAYRGFVPVHALRGPSRGGGALQAPLVILVVTLAIGVFSTIVVASLQRQQDLVAWMAVGAEYRIDSATRDNLPLGVAEVPGVEAAAEVILRDGFLAGGSVRAMPVVAEALDAEAYRRVVAGTPADGLLPEAFTSTGWDGSAGMTPETAVPAILVGQAARRPALSVGQAFELSGLGKASHFRVAAVEAEFPGAGSPQGTVIVPAGAVRAADPTHAFAPNQIFVRASPAIGARCGTGRWGVSARRTSPWPRAPTSERGWRRIPWSVTRRPASCSHSALRLPSRRSS